MQPTFRSGCASDSSSSCVSEETGDCKMNHAAKRKTKKLHALESGRTERDLLQALGQCLARRFDPDLFDYPSCMECGAACHDDFAVQDQIWLQAVPGCAGHLHLCCLEKRVGRALVVEDFQQDAPCNQELLVAMRCGWHWESLQNFDSRLRTIAWLLLKRLEAGTYPLPNDQVGPDRPLSEDPARLLSEIIEDGTLGELGTFMTLIDSRT